MASFFNMKGTTQTEFMVGIKGPVLKKYDFTANNATTTYLLMPDNTIISKVVFDKDAPTQHYINKTDYTGNAATATKLKTKNIGLAITGLSVSHRKNNGETDSGLSDGSDKIYGELLEIDSSKLVKGQTGVPYTVLADLVASGDLGGTVENADSKIASANHTHSQYLQAGTSGFTISTKSGETGLGGVKIDNANESSTTTTADPQKLLLNLVLRNNAVAAANITNGAVTTDKLDDGAVTAAKIADDSIAPKHLADLISDGNGGYTNGDYSGQIARVVSADNLNVGGKIAGILISSILHRDNNTNYTAIVNNAWNAYNVYDTTNSASKSAADVISAVNTVAAASGTKSVGNLVKWTNDGITGNLKGDVTGNLSGNATTATSAGKLTTAVTLWGNSFDGSGSLGVSTTAASISYTGDITPQSNNKYSLGTSDLKYKNAYLSEKLTAKDIDLSNLLTTLKITISDGNGAGINMNNHNITAADSITANTYASASSASVLGSATSPFAALYIKGPEYIKWKVSNNDVTLKGALDGKANSDHGHRMKTDLTVSSGDVDANGYLTIDNGNNTAVKLATDAHTHSLSDIEGVTGIYQFKDTIQAVTIGENENAGKILVPSIANPSNGDVYNVLTEFEYEGETYPAGTNIVYEKDIATEVNGQTVYTGIWKPIGGSFNVDLGKFVTGFEVLDIVDANNKKIYKGSSGQAYNATGTAVINSYNVALAISLSNLYDDRKRTQEQITNNIVPFVSSTIVLPKATHDNFGLVKIFNETSAEYTAGATETNKNYGVLLDDNNRAYVHVPWTDTKTIDKYDLITTHITTADDFSDRTFDSNTFNAAGLIDYSGVSGVSDPYLKLRWNNDNIASIKKRIQIVGTGQATAKLSTNGDGRDSKITIDVPKRAGYSIPLIKCMSEPIICDYESHGVAGVSNTIGFTADPTVYSENGVFSCDGNKIKDGSLVLLYLEHVDKIYNIVNELAQTKECTYNNGVIQIQVYVPPSALSYELNGYGCTFVLTTTDRESEFMYFADFSKKLFLCQLNLSHGNNTVPYDGDAWDTGHSTATLKILEDIGHTFDDLNAPEVHLKKKRFRLSRPSDTLGGIIRRYAGIAKVIVRTLFLGKNNAYVPLKDLDIDLTDILIRPDYNPHQRQRNAFNVPLNYEDTDGVGNPTNKINVYDSGVDLYSRHTLIDNVCYDYHDFTKYAFSDSTQTKNILFKGDKINLHSLKKERRGAYLQKKQNIGIRKHNGNISLDKLDIDFEKKMFMRDYTKIKFQYILQFNNSDMYNICGGISGDEYTLSKSQTVKGGYWAINIDKNIK